ncbi:MAG: hypothetical protein R8G34_08925 [Paracoccaceae bacterium]|nr:hypothetical protein [Paracoccaceae bacterium]
MQQSLKSHPRVPIHLSGVRLSRRFVGGLLIAGRVGAIQSAVGIGALPFSFVMVLICAQRTLCRPFTSPNGLLKGAVRALSFG